jgi:hypothetical protein
MGRRRIRRRYSGLASGLLRGAAGLAVVGGIACAAWYSQPEPRDEETLCLKIPSGSAFAVSETAHHILIVDKTDKWSSPQGSRLRNVVGHLRNELNINERLSIFVFSDTVAPGFPPKFSLCNPGRGSDTTFWTSNPRRWEKKFTEKFGKPLDDIVNELTAATEGPHSPILEVLIDITNREELNKGDIRRRIVFVSDMLQNSDAYTFLPPKASAPPSRPMSSSPSRLPPGMGGPYVPLPLQLLPFTQAQPTVPSQNDVKRVRALKPKSAEPKKVSPKEIEAMVQRKGGLDHLRKFSIAVYQIHGVYPEEKLRAAREFWDSIAVLYGSKIEWKVM